MLEAHENLIFRGAGGVGNRSGQFYTRRLKPFYNTSMASFALILHQTKNHNLKGPIVHGVLYILFPLYFFSCLFSYKQVHLYFTRSPYSCKVILFIGDTSLSRCVKKELWRFKQGVIHKPRGQLRGRGLAK